MPGNVVETRRQGFDGNGHRITRNRGRLRLHSAPLVVGDSDTAHGGLQVLGEGQRQLLRGLCHARACRRVGQLQMGMCKSGHGQSRQGESRN